MTNAPSLSCSHRNRLCCLFLRVQSDVHPFSTNPRDPFRIGWAVRLDLQLWGELNQHSHRLDLQAVSRIAFWPSSDCSNSWNFAISGISANEAGRIGVVGVAEGSALDSQLPEHLMPASWSLLPGFGPDGAILNFVQNDCRCHCGFLLICVGGWFARSDCFSLVG